jgi:hypothetical protein
VSWEDLDRAISGLRWSDVVAQATALADQLGQRQYLDGLYLVGQQRLIGAPAEARAAVERFNAALTRERASRSKRGARRARKAR